MKKNEILRGRTAFARLVRSGRRVDGELMRCYYRIGSGEKSSLMVGFSVPGRTLKAARRNRMRRLMREAFTLEKGPLISHMSEAGVTASLLLLYRPARTTDVRRLSLASVQADTIRLCRMLTARM